MTLDIVHLSPCCPTGDPWDSLILSGPQESLNFFRWRRNDAKANVTGLLA